MKFVCDSCNTKYSIADERVHGRVLKIRCKTCDHVITVREEHKPAPGNIAEALGRGLGSDAGDDHTVVSQMAMSPPPVEQPADEWYVSFDGEQEGPMPLQRAHERVRAERPRGKEAHCWRPGFFVWLAVEEVPEFAPALQKPRPPVRPAVKPAPPVVAKPKSPSGAQAVLKSPTGSQPVLPEQIKAETPRAPEPPKAPGPPKELPKLEPLPAIDSKPMALPPPPGPAVETATPLNLPLPLIPAPMPPTDSIPSGPMAVQVTRPEPRLTRKQLEEKKPEEKKPEKLEEKKPPEEKKEEKKIEPLLPVREPSAPEVSPFVAALAAAKGEDPKPPFDTGPVPLPPPPGSEADLAFSEPSGVLSLSHLPQPSLARSLEKPAIDTFGGVAVTPPGSNGTASAAPVVVVAGPVQSTAPWVKYTIGVLLVLVVSLGAMLIYKSRGPAPADKPAAVVPQPASTGKHVDDKPI
jgi:predicted Zn finger-like uncharacterized protein